MNIIEKKSIIIKDFDDLKTFKKLYKKDYMLLEPVQKEDFPIKVTIKEERNENICK